MHAALTPPQALEQLERLERTIQCPITHQLLVDPVIVFQSGQTYERQAVVHWMKCNKFKDPVTNQTYSSPLRFERNDAVVQIVQYFKSIKETHGKRSSICKTKRRSVGTCYMQIRRYWVEFPSCKRAAKVLSEKIGIRFSEQRIHQLIHTGAMFQGLRFQTTRPKRTVKEGRVNCEGISKLLVQSRASG